MFHTEHLIDLTPSVASYRRESRVQTQGPPRRRRSEALKANISCRFRTNALCKDRISCILSPPCTTSHAISLTLGFLQKRWILISRILLSTRPAKLHHVLHRDLIGLSVDSSSPLRSCSTSRSTVAPSMSWWIVCCTLISICRQEVKLQNA